MNRVRLAASVGVFLLFGVGCSDSTAPVPEVNAHRAQPSDALGLSTIVVQDADGTQRTTLLLGNELVLPSGAHVHLDDVRAARFRRISADQRRVEALAQSLSPLWKRMGLPEPGTAASFAYIKQHPAFFTYVQHDPALNASLMNLQSATVLRNEIPSAPRDGLPNAHRARAPGDRGGGPEVGSMMGTCERLGLGLYESTSAWRDSMAWYNQALTDFTRCAESWGPAWASRSRPSCC